MILYIDIIDACHLRCPTCVRGVRAFPNTDKKMTVGTFRQIVEKGKRDGAYQISIFSWIDPLLCRDLYAYTAVVKEFDLHCEISTTLSFPKLYNFAEALRTIDAMTISVSGFEQSIYEVNHRGGNIDWVKNNLEVISQLKREKRTSVDATVRFLLFDYNRGEESKLRDYANYLGLRFEVLIAEGHPTLAPQPHEAERLVIERLKTFSSKPNQDTRGKVCPLIFEHITVNADGDVYQCTAYGNYDVMKIGPYLDLSREEILFRRYTHPVCNSCPWTRRPATEQEKLLLSQALSYRVGNEISGRVPHLSLPAPATPVTPEGYLVPKSQQAEWTSVQIDER